MSNSWSWRDALRLSFEPRGPRGGLVFVSVWLAILTIAFVWNFSFVFWGPRAVASAEGGAWIKQEGGKFGFLPTERSHVAALSLAHAPLAPLPPPMDSRLRGDPNGVLALMQQRAAECRPDGDALSDVAETVPPGVRMRALYYEGRVALCQGRAGDAGERFKEAQDLAAQANAGVTASRAQFQVAAAYGRVIALIDQGRDKLSEADKALSEAQSRAIPHDRSAFAVTPVMLDGVAINLALAKSQPGTVVYRIKALSRSGRAYVEPRETANAAVAAVAAGRPEFAASLFEQVESALRNAPDRNASPWLTTERLALGRLCAMAAVSPTPEIYTQQDDWWPTGEGVSHGAAEGAATPRAVYESRFTARDAYWFPPIALEGRVQSAEGGDAEGLANTATADARWIDTWLWIRRERALLSQADLQTFAEDAAAIDHLDTTRKAFVRDWRRQATVAVGGPLLARAAQMRRTDDPQSAHLMLTLLAGPDFPWNVSWPARLMLPSNLSPWVTLGLKLASLVFWVGLFLAHCQLRIGYARAFPDRHHRDRLEQERKRGDAVVAAPTA